MIAQYKKILTVFAFMAIFLPVISFAEPVINLNGPALLPRAEIFITPTSGNFITGSTFEAPIYINTKGNNINAVSIKLQYDPSKLSIVKPSGGKSIFGIWVEPPSYDNVKGTASLVGVIPNGIVTSSGLIATVTFKAVASGDTRVTFSDYTSANMNDGLGSEIKLTLSGSSYTLTPKAPEGVTVSSDTHPFQDHWYNNSSPIIRWDSPQGVTGYSALIDSNPNTVPPTNITTNVSQASYENLKDGVWYFHVRANVKGVWGNTTHFQIKIDTEPPAKFTPVVSTLKDSTGDKKYLLAFLTTDSLSNIERYEVGSINKISSKVASPVFIQTESPYLVPATNNDSIRVIIRAFDTAGNIQESSIDLYPGFTFIQAVKKYGFYLLILIIILLLLELLLHYLFGHHILDHMKKAYRYFKKVSVDEEKNEIPTKEDNP